MEYSGVSELNAVERARIKKHLVLKTKVVVCWFFHQRTVFRLDHVTW